MRAIELRDRGREGVRLSKRPARFHFSWSSETPRSGVRLSVLNEAFIAGSRALIAPESASFYLHVDDGVFFSKPPPLPSQASLGDSMAVAVAEAWEDLGFSVPDRALRQPVAKALGFIWEEEQGR